ncbi:abscisic acid 8'-hydroxylase 3 isoform X2 [Dendrobium catenatum]|uniref:(+)-abscisic acid 8'-hydroxylase n=1 Tax=Dendrobium catenatum TaxID=906689 RepID=A0A2I0VJR1_9ASPA|nr:abscisic acid 8'-hydroxylase 3 isoform X2 [Dendrobium catenatum]PKU63647.1 Abscisic acid 8'-hydroxylase 3 [Dendrobium catenatum]
MDIFYSPMHTFLLIFSILFYLLMRKQSNNNRSLQGKLPLPPGSMGWPYIGETFQLFSQDPNIFFPSRQERYGEIFKTHLLGCPCVMLASAEAARFVLVSKAQLFKPKYPRSKERLIGPWALFFHQGGYHAIVRKLVQSSLSPESIRRLVPDIDAVASATLRSWDGHMLSTFHAMKEMSFDVGILIIFGEHLSKQRKNEIKRNYFIVDKGYNSFATSIPGTAYSNAIKARKRLGEILSEIMEERREHKTMEKDLLSCFLEWKNDKGERLSDNQISDNIFGVLYAAQDTTASVITWMVKYLHDDPKLLEAVKAEQMSIYKRNGCGSQQLQWAHTRKMPFTQRVISESLRMASIISFTYREAVADVEYKGYLIPKGWKVMPLFRNIHHSSEYFPDPHKFDPSRFKASPKPNTFLPFGNGVHSCPGNELAKIEMLVFIHHLVTKYRFEVVGSHSEVEYSPFPIPKHGLQVRIWSTEQADGIAE